MRQPTRTIADVTPETFQAPCPNCGAKPFLQQFQRYRFNPGQFEYEPKVILFDGASGFVVRKPKIEGKPRMRVSRSVTDDDVPF